MKPLTKTALLMYLFCLSYTPAAAQINLVPNPSFEEYDSCPMFYPDLDGNLKYWTSFRGTPDYMNDCSSVCGYSNQWGYQMARTGNAYTGIVSFDRNSNFKENIGVELISNLSIGKKYYASFYVSLAFSEQVNIATNNIGLLVTTNKYNDPNSLLPNQNYCTVNATSIIKDTLQWVKISGSFIADYSYQYLIIGNFFDNSNTDTFHLPDLAFGNFVSYYYLDDICLSEDSTLCFSDKAKCDFVLPTAFSPNGDNINDIYRTLTNCNNYKDFTMNIYNRWGEKVFTTRDISYAWDGRFKGEEQATDVYAVHVSVVIDGKPISKISNLTLFR